MSIQTEVQTGVAVETMTYRQAVIAAMADEMSDDPSVVLMGEDVAEAGGVFKTSEGLLEAFGPNRVFNTPICENGFVGAALGMAATGLRPIAEIMFSDFLPTAGDAIVNELPKFRFMSGGQLSAPVTVRAIGGATGGFGTQHSATGESWFLQVAGLHIAVAGSPSGAYDLLRLAIRCDDPVLLFEHKGLYNTRGPVQRRSPVSSIGEVEVVRPGSDLTLVASLLMVERAQRAAEKLQNEHGISVEVIDIRWVRPIDHSGIRRSLERTGRLLIVEEELHDGSWGASVVSRLVVDGFEFARAPRMIGLPHDLPMPYSPPLEKEAVPDEDDIIREVLELVQT